MWLGYQQSLRPCQTGLMLNMDVAATAFIEPMDAVPFIADAARAQDVQRMNPMQTKKANSAVRGVQVGINCFSRSQPSAVHFSLDLNWAKLLAFPQKRRHSGCD